MNIWEYILDKALELFANMDERVLWAIIVLAVIAIIWAIVKKAVKLAVIVLAIAVIFGGIRVNLDIIKEKYWVALDNGNIVATVNGEQYSIPVDSIAEVRVEDTENTGDSSKRITVVLVGGVEQSLIAPRVVASVVEGVADKAGIEVQKPGTR